MTTSRPARASASSSTPSIPTIPSPRVCAQFSEDLVKQGVDYSQFVTVDDAAPEGSQRRRPPDLRRGPGARQATTTSPSARACPRRSARCWKRRSLLSIYIQDRAPSARFTGDSFVLPSTARHGIPVVTVNMDVADVKLFRIGDRSLAQLLSGYQFLRQLDGYDMSSIADQMGEPVWEGKLEIANDLNKEVTTSFPIDEALPDRKPGVYVLTAQPENDRRDDLARRAPRSGSWSPTSGFRPIPARTG